MKRVSLNKNIQDLANVADEIVQIQQDVNTRFTEDEGHIKRESIHPLQGKATGVTNISARCEIGFLKQWTANILVSGKSLAPNAYYILNLGTRPNVNIAAQKDGYHYAQMYDGSIYHSWTHKKYSGNILITITYDGNTCKCYYNGEYQGKDYIGELNFNKLIFINNSSVNESNMNIGITNIFNYALSPEEVKELYNNGRPDKVVFGNERKNKVQPILNNIVNGGTSAGLNFVSNIGNRSAAWSGVIENTSTSAARTNFIFNKDLIEGEAYTSKFIIKGNYIGKVYIRYGDIGVASGQTMIFNKLDTNDFEIYVELKKQGSATSGNDVIQVFFQLTTGQEFNTEIVNASTKIKACIAEYLPSSLTPTTWFDTSGNSNHLTATGTPELIYEEPIKDIVYSNSQPTESPQFKGQLHINSSTNKIYIGK